MKLHAWPRVSVVIPNYNQGRFLAQAIASIREQGYPDVEIIVMDGGSDDDSEAVIRRNEEHLAYWSSEPDRGQSHALNKGFSKATGDIYGWLNADDIYLPNAIRGSVQQFLEQERKHVVFGDYVLLDVDGCITERVPTFPFSVRHFIYEGFGLNAQAMFWTREAHGRTGEFDESLYRTMDYDFILRMGLTLGRNAFLWQPRAMGAFRRHADQKTMDFDDQVEVEHRYIAAKLGFRGKYSTRGHFLWYAYRLRRCYWYGRRRGLAWTAGTALQARWSPQGGPRA